MSALMSDDDMFEIDDPLDVDTALMTAYADRMDVVIMALGVPVTFAMLAGIRIRPDWVIDHATMFWVPPNLTFDYGHC